MQIIEKVGEPLSKESIKSGFLKTLTPLRLENASIRGISICDLEIHKISVSNGVPRIRLKHIYHNGIRPLCLLYEEGILLKFNFDYYYFPFSAATNGIKAKLLFKESRDLSYEISRSDNKQEILQDMLDNDYYYHYTKTLTGESSGQYLDTRHYTKSGALDKRYSKQNLQRGGSYIHQSYSVEEKFLAHKGYILYIDDLVELMVETTKEGFLSLTAKLFSKSGCQNIEVDENYGAMYWRKVIAYVRLLTEADRRKIKSLLSASSVQTDDPVEDLEGIQEGIKAGRYKKIDDGVERPMTVKEVLEFKEKMKNLSKRVPHQDQYEALFNRILNSRKFELSNIN